MKSLKIGIMPREQYQKRILAIAAGSYKPKAGEPKIWFSSMKSMAEVLSEHNMRLLQLIAEEKPQSLKELAQLSGRKESNLSRTLHTLHHYGIVDLRKGEHGRSIVPVVMANRFDIQAALS